MHERSAFPADLQTFRLTHSAVVKEFGGNFKNEVAVARRPRPHFKLRRFFFFPFYIFAPGLFVYMASAHRRLRNNKCWRNAFRRPGTTAALCRAVLPTPIDSIKMLKRRSAAAVGEAVRAQPPRFSCRALQQIKAVAAERLRCGSCSPLPRRITPPTWQALRFLLFRVFFNAPLLMQCPKW